MRTSLCGPVHSASGAAGPGGRNIIKETSIIDGYSIYHPLERFAEVLVRHHAFQLLLVLSALPVSRFAFLALEGSPRVAEQRRSLADARGSG